MSSPSRLRTFLPFAVLLAGVAIAVVLVRARSAPEPVERPALGPLVEVIAVTEATRDADLTLQGEVAPEVEAVVASQVGGRIVEVSPRFVSGGRFAAGETLVRIDDRDYRLAVEKAKAAVARAATQLEREEAEAAAARAEWQELHGVEPAPPLVARAPQTAQARAELDGARADLAVAELALERTRLSLPFAGVVISESANLGELLGVGQSVGQVYAIERVEIRLPIDDRDLAWIDVPELGERGPAAVVRARLFGADHRWPARVDRLEGRLDPRSRLAHLVVAVDRPIDAAGERPPLLPGTFVDVDVDGRPLESVALIPRAALREGATAWVVEGDRLRIRALDVARTDREHAWVVGGLAGGDRLVVSSLDAVTDGMVVRAVDLDLDRAGDGR